MNGNGSVCLRREYLPSLQVLKAQFFGAVNVSKEFFDASTSSTFVGFNYTRQHRASWGKVPPPSPKTRTSKRPKTNNVIPVRSVEEPQNIHEPSKRTTKASPSSTNKAPGPKPDSSTDSQQARKRSSRKDRAGAQ